MGTWGPRIFDDDTACDTRFEYRDLLSHGATGPQATDHMIQIHATGPDFGGYQLTFWLALAATQSRLGRLEDRVRDKALKIIDSGEDLAAWDQPGPTFLRRRRAALQRLRRRLLGPQLAPVSVKQCWRQTTELQPGQHVLYRRRDGRRMLLRVMDVEHYGACTYPMVMVLSWRDGEPLPSGQTLTQLGSAHAFSHGEPCGSRSSVAVRPMGSPSGWRSSASGGMVRYRTGTVGCRATGTSSATGRRRQWQPRIPRADHSSVVDTHHALRHSPGKVPECPLRRLLDPLERNTTLGLPGPA
jgi:hypothetical protein